MKNFFRCVFIFLFLATLTGCRDSISTNGSTPAVTSLHKEVLNNEMENVTKDAERFDSEVVCADMYVTQIHKTISNINKSIEIIVAQGKDESNTIIRTCANDSAAYTITVEDESKKVIQTLVSNFQYRDALTFADVNLDGYADVQIHTGGTLNETTDLYLWDTSLSKFVKVLYQGFDMLAYFEIEDGYLNNWVKRTATSGVIQRLEWDRSMLNMVSEKEYDLNKGSQGDD